MNWVFWYICGLVVGGLVVAGVLYLVQKRVFLTWYEWILAVITLVLFTFTLETFVHSFAEMQPKAAWMSLLFLGLPTVIFAVITGRLVWARLPKSGGQAAA